MAAYFLDSSKWGGEVDGGCVGDALSVEILEGDLLLGDGHVECVCWVC